MYCRQGAVLKVKGKAHTWCESFCWDLERVLVVRVGLSGDLIFGETRLSMPICGNLILWQ